MKQIASRHAPSRVLTIDQPPTAPDVRGAHLTLNHGTGIVIDPQDVPALIAELQRYAPIDPPSPFAPGDTIRDKRNGHLQTVDVVDWKTKRVGTKELPGWLPWEHIELMPPAPVEPQTESLGRLPVGSEVQFRGTISSIGNGTTMIRSSDGHDFQFLNRTRVEVVKRAPKPFEVGELVQTVEGNRVKILAIDDDLAWVKHDATGRFLTALDKLERVE